MKSKENVDYNNWNVKEALSLRDRMIKIGWHKLTSNVLGSYEQLTRDIEDRIINKTEDLIESLISKEQWFRIFMLTHSIFIIKNDGNEIKWYNKESERMLRKIIVPKEEDIDLMKSVFTTDDDKINMIMNAFDARPVKFIKYALKLNIGFSGYDAINLHWEGFEPPVNVDKELSSFKVIDL